MTAPASDEIRSSMGTEGKATEEETDAVAGLNQTKVEWKAKELRMQGVKYALNPADNKVYDFESYQAAVAGQGQPIQVGTLEIADGRYEYRPI